VRCCAVLCCAVRCGAVRCGAKRGRDLVTIASKSHVSTSGHAGDHRNQCKCELTSAHNASLLCCTLAALAESVRASAKEGGGGGEGSALEDNVDLVKMHEHGVTLDHVRVVQLAQKTRLFQARLAICCVSAGSKAWRVSEEVSE